MRSISIGLLLVGALIMLATLILSEAAADLRWAVIGGALFVGGAVFAAAAGLKDAIERR